MLNKLKTRFFSAASPQPPVESPLWAAERLTDDQLKTKTIQLAAFARYPIAAGDPNGIGWKTRNRRQFQEFEFETCLAVVRSRIRDEGLHGHPQLADLYEYAVLSDADAPDLAKSIHDKYRGGRDKSGIREFSFTGFNS